MEKLFEGSVDRGFDQDIFEWAGLDLTEDEREVIWEYYNAESVMENCPSASFETENRQLDEDDENFNYMWDPQIWVTATEPEKVRSELREFVAKTLGYQPLSSNGPRPELKAAVNREANVAPKQRQTNPDVEAALDAASETWGRGRYAYSARASLTEDRSNFREVLYRYAEAYAERFGRSPSAAHLIYAANFMDSDRWPDEWPAPKSMGQDVDFRRLDFEWLHERVARAEMLGA